MSGYASHQQQHHHHGARSTSRAAPLPPPPPPPPPQDPDEASNDLTAVSLSQVRQDTTTDLSLTVRSSDFYDTSTSATDDNDNDDNDFDDGGGNNGDKHEADHVAASPSVGSSSSRGRRADVDCDGDVGVEDDFEEGEEKTDDDDDEEGDGDDDDEHWWEPPPPASNRSAAHAQAAASGAYDEYTTTALGGEEGYEELDPAAAAAASAHAGLWIGADGGTDGGDDDDEVARWVAGDEANDGRNAVVGGGGGGGGGEEEEEGVDSAGGAAATNRSASQNPLKNDRVFSADDAPASPPTSRKPAGGSAASPTTYRPGSGGSGLLLSPWKAPSEPSTPSIKFKKGKLLGKGAYGAVYQGMNVMTGELIAVKEIDLPSDVSAKAIKDIQREIAVMARLPPHPNCVRYLDTYRTSRHIYILMEHVSGGSVASMLASVGRFHEATIREYGYMTLLGIKHLHDHNILHQDIKGQNVLLDERGQVKLADFGCSRDLNQMSQTIKMCGTPLWLDPAVVRGSPATTKSDLWSWGCFMIEMASDTHLPWNFERGTPVLTVLYAIGAATKPPEIPSHLSPLAKDLIGQCLRINPDERPTVDEVLEHPFFSTITFHDAEGVEHYVSNEHSGADRSTLSSSMRSSVEDGEDGGGGGGFESSSSFKGFASDELLETDTSPDRGLFVARAVAANATSNNNTKGGTSVNPSSPPRNPLSSSSGSPSSPKRFGGSGGGSGQRTAPARAPSKHLDPSAVAGPLPAPPPGAVFNAPVVWHSSGTDHVTPNWRKHSERPIDETHPMLDHGDETSRASAGQRSGAAGNGGGKPKKTKKDKQSSGLMDKLKCMF